MQILTAHSAQRNLELLHCKLSWTYGRRLSQSDRAALIHRVSAMLPVTTKQGGV